MMKREPEYYLEKMSSPVERFTDISAEHWLKISSDDSKGLDWMIATGVYDIFESNFSKWESDDPEYGDFILVSKENWNRDKNTGTMYIFSCSLTEGDSGIMTFVIPDFWEHEMDAIEIIMKLNSNIKGKEVVTYPFDRPI